MDDGSGHGRSVLVVTSQADHAGLGEAMASDRRSVVTVRTVEAATMAFDPSTVACVVTVESLPDGTWRDVLEIARSHSPDHPVVCYPAECDDEFVAAASAADVTRVLPQSVDDPGHERLREAVESTIDVGNRRGERRRAERMLHTLETDLPVSMYFKDRDARHVWVSSTVGPRTTTADAIGKTDLELYGEEIGEAARRSYEDDLRVIETGEPIIEKEEATVADGNQDDTLWVRSTKLPWRDEAGEICGLVGITQDVTELKRNERELETRSRRLDRFASFASHDLRNPLNVAQGYLEHGLETGDEASFEAVGESLDRMDRLVDELLSAAQAGESHTESEMLALSHLVESVWADLEASEAQLQVAVGTDTVVRANDGQLRQLLGNLFRNAIEHGGSDVTVAVGELDRGFYVEDDGPGIPPERREEVFEYGVTGSATGTGLGLSIVSEVATNHDWEVAVVDGDGGGARFEVINCPVVTRATAPATAEWTTRPSETRDVGGATPSGETRRERSGRDWTIRGGGRNVWHETDECHLAYAQLDGDGSILARVTALEPISEYSKAGVTIRADERAGAALGYVGALPSGEIEVLWRPDGDEPITSYHPPEEPTLPRWFRIDRAGDVLTCYHSIDGDTWRPIDERVVAVGDVAVAGIAVCSHDRNRRTNATFEEVAVVTNGPAEYRR